MSDVSDGKFKKSYFACRHLAHLHFIFMGWIALVSVFLFTSSYMLLKEGAFFQVSIFITMSLAFYFYLSRNYLLPLKRIVCSFQSSSIIEENHFQGTPEEIQCLIRKYNEALREIEGSIKKEAFYETAEQVAHDIRSPVAALRLVLKTLPDFYGKKLLNETAHRIYEITESLQKKPQKICLEKVNLMEVCQSVLKSFEGVNILLSFDKGASSDIFVKVDVLLLKRALYNLIDNAREAIEKKGRGKIELKILKIGSRCLLQLCDEGVGMQSSWVLKLGKEEISSKPKGWGRGVLYAARYLEACGGRLSFLSQEGRGTKVYISLPMSS